MTRPRIVQTAGTCFLDGTDIPTREIASRFRAGDCISDICHDFGLTFPQVEECLRFELLSAKGKRDYLATGGE